jgi:hypothetical protein
LPLCLLHREKTNQERGQGGSHCRCVCYTERRQTKREGREVAIAAVFATQIEDKLRERAER